MVSSICWNDSVNMLAAMQDNKFIVWYHPAVIYSDRDLLPLTQFTKEERSATMSQFDGPETRPLPVLHFRSYRYFYFCSEVSRSPQLVQFTGRHCILRRSDGASIATALSPFPTLLHQHAATGNWEAAVRLCRFVEVGGGGKEGGREGGTRLAMLSCDCRTPPCGRVWLVWPLVLENSILPK